MEQTKRSSTFFRVEKNIGDGFVSVYEFHTVINGNMYIAHHEEKDGSRRWMGRRMKTNKELGNKRYKELLTDGYQFAGKYQMDIYGHKEVYHV